MSMHGGRMAAFFVLAMGTFLFLPIEMNFAKEVCQPGYYFAVHLCQPCPLGAYKSQIGLQNCQLCPTDAEGYRATTLQRASTSHEDCIFMPVITRFSPVFGPVCGVTAITIQLKYLNSMDIRHASIAGGFCTNLTTDAQRSTVRCMTSAVSHTSQGPLRLAFDNGVVLESSANFTYVEDPVIKIVDRIKTIISGGLSIDVYGEGFRSIVKPAMLITRVRKQWSKSFTVDCVVKTDTKFSCITPYLRWVGDVPESTVQPPITNADDSSLIPPTTTLSLTTADEMSVNEPQMTSPANQFQRRRQRRRKRALPDGPIYNDRDTHFYLGFRLDGVRTYENMTRVIPRYGQLLVYEDPMYYTFRENAQIRSYTAGSKEFLHLLGRHLNYACDRDDMSVMVGKRACNITMLASNQLTCLPPATVLSTANTLAPVTVRVGTLTFNVGYLDYVDSHEKHTIILAVILCLLAVFLAIVAITFIWYRWRQKRQEKNCVHVADRHVETRRQLSTSHYVSDFPAQADSGYLVPTNNNDTNRQHSRRQTLSSLVSVADGSGSTQMYSDRPSSSESYFENGQFFSKSGREWDLMAEISLNAELVSLVDKYRIDGDRLTLGDTIGQGFFGKVYKGVLSDVGSCDPEVVAVKTVAGEHCTSKDLTSFLEEALIMKDFKHENVLSLVGVVIKFNRPHVVLPYMAHGDLRSYVKDSSKMLAVRDLIEFAVQIANGMVYLSHLKFVHRDLAARNCMVDDKLTTKIADFGLSRDIYKSEYYRVENKHRPLPVRWMALESLTIGVFTAKSDVWSYGVVVWELLTRGCLPYTDIDSFNIRGFIQSGRRMPQPRHAPDEIYELLLRCWDENTAQRPSFKYLHDTLYRLLQNRTSQNTAEYLQIVDT